MWWVWCGGCGVVVVDLDVNSITVCSGCVVWCGVCGGVMGVVGVVGEDLDANSHGCVVDMVWW